MISFNHAYGTRGNEDRDRSFHCNVFPRRRKYLYYTLYCTSSSSVTGSDLSSLFSLLKTTIISIVSTWKVQLFLRAQIVHDINLRRRIVISFIFHDVINLLVTIHLLLWVSVSSLFPLYRYASYPSCKKRWNTQFKFRSGTIVFGCLEIRFVLSFLWWRVILIRRLYLMIVFLLLLIHRNGWRNKNVVFDHGETQRMTLNCVRIVHNMKLYKWSSVNWRVERGSSLDRLYKGISKL